MLVMVDPPVVNFLNASISICKSYRTVSNMKLVCQASPIEFGNRLLSIEERRGKLKYLSC